MDGIPTGLRYQNPELENARIDKLDGGQGVSRIVYFDLTTE